jgi:hypothetical protein
MMPNRAMIPERIRQMPLEVMFFHTLVCMLDLEYELNERHLLYTLPVYFGPVGVYWVEHKLVDGSILHASGHTIEEMKRELVDKMLEHYRGR